MINNKKVRLKDIHNLFMDTGIGKQAYSIIGQGRVERIISSNPKEKLRNSWRSWQGLKELNWKRASFKKIRKYICRIRKKIICVENGCFD